MAKHIDLVEEYKRGQHLLSDDLNSLIATAKRGARFANGFAGGDTDVSADINKHAQVIHGINKTGITISAYSLFAVSGATAFADPPKVELQKFGRITKGSQFAFMTNGQFPIPNNDSLQLLPLSYDVPRLLTCNSLSEVPAIGESCGPVLESFGISRKGFGLVCVSAPDSTGLNVWVLQSRNPVRVVGFVTEEITAYNATTKTLGKGKIKIQFRDASDVLAVAKDSQNVDWVVDVYNCLTRICPVDMLIEAIETLGIGLTVSTPQVAHIGKTALAFNKGTSASILRYKGLSGTETDTGFTDTVKNVFRNVATDKKIIYIEIDGINYAIAGEC